jgi:hypothetical protein
MSKLFIIENNVCKPNPEVLLITPFKEIWEADADEHKGEAINKFTFMEFYASKAASNPYAEYDDRRRLEELSQQYLGECYFRYPQDVPLDLVHGISKIEEFQEEGSASMRLYKGNLISVNKMLEFLNDFDPSEKTMSGGLVIKPADITNNVAKAMDAMISLETMRKKVQQEMLESSKTKGGKQISSYERVL